MYLDRFMRILRDARPVLAAATILSLLAVAVPSASAGVTLSIKAADVGTAGTFGPVTVTSGVSTTFVLGNFGTVDDPVTVTASRIDSPSGSNLTATEISLENKSSGTDTLKLFVTGVGYSLGGTAFAGETLVSNFSIGGSGGPASTVTDTSTAKAWIDTTNALFGTNTPLGSLTVVPLHTTNLTTNYTSGL
jgi:hypothetical protein